MGTNTSGSTHALSNGAISTIRPSLELHDGPTDVYSNESQPIPILGSPSNFTARETAQFSQSVELISSRISVYYQNVRGLRTKSREFYGNSCTHEHEIVVLTETWLNGDHSSSEYFDTSFNAFRKDRCDTGSQFHRGGGVLIASHTKFKSSEIQLSEADNMECICLKININSRVNIYVYAAYIPPNSSEDVYKMHTSIINNIPAKSSDTVLILGDFNIPNAEWTLDQHVMVPIAIRPDYAAEFVRSMTEKGLCQINGIRNEQHNLLDLVFTNEITSVEVHRPPAMTRIDVYHPPLLLSFEWHVEKPQADETVIRNFNSANYVGMNWHFAEICFEELFHQKSLHEMATIFHEIVKGAINTFVPIARRVSHSKYPWNNTQLQRLKNIKNKEWKRYKISGERARFDDAFTAFDTLNKELYDGYLRKIASSTQSNPSSFWKFVSSKRSLNGFPTTFSLDDRCSIDAKEQTEFFATYFSRNFTSPASDNTSITQNRRNYQITEMFLLDEYQVFEGLLNIKVKSGIGEDGIHPLLLRNCAALIYKPLTAIFNESLSKGEFPDLWKRYSVRPVFKSGNRSKIENYRCIAKLPAIAKLFECLVNRRLSRMVESRISPHQHGFMRGRSTITNLMDFTCFASKSLANGSQVDVLYTDFAKAFDKLNQKKLVEKLEHFNLPGNLLDWLTSYLSARKQFVRFKGIESKDFTVNSGVPQGSHLGPTLFVLFINDIADNIGNDIFVSLFADDLKMATKIAEESDGDKLQVAINELKLWCDTNDLHLNLAKCKILSITRRRGVMNRAYHYAEHTFERTNVQKDLGVLIDTRLEFIKHIGSITSRASTALGFVRRFCYDMRNTRTSKLLFFTLVQSILEYASTVWFPFYEVHKNKIESILRQFSMFALREYPTPENNYRISSYDQRLSKLNMNSLQRRRVNSALIFMFDIVHNNVHCPLLRQEILMNNSSRHLRQTDFVRLRDPSLRLARTDPINQHCRLANKISGLMRVPSTKNAFRSQLIKIEDAQLLG